MTKILLLLALLSGAICQARATAPDVRGRKFTAAGTEPDRIEVEGKVFAQGLHKVQSMAWHGRDLWVCNAPDLTILRDLDGDDSADEYVLMGRGLEGLNRLAWGADGKLYLFTSDLASMPQHELGRPMVFRAEEYVRHAASSAAGGSHEKAWLRCEADGRGLEVVGRGADESQIPPVMSPGALVELEVDMDDPKRGRAYAQWSFEELWNDLGSGVPAQNIAAQEELLKRGESIKVGLLEKLAAPHLPQAKRAWALWTLGRAGKDDVEIESWFAAQPLTAKDVFTRVECLKIIGYRMKEFGFTKEVPPCVSACLKDPLPEVREAAEQMLAALKK